MKIPISNIRVGVGWALAYYRITTTDSPQAGKGSLAGPR